MAKRRGEYRFRSERTERGSHTPTRLPEPLPLPEGCRLVRVFVEGYEDVAFWRSIFDSYESPTLRFEISVPPRKDLAKGKKVLLSLADECHSGLVMCMDSDFDYLFADQTRDARIINSSPYLLHTYVYSTENFVCYAPSLHNVCVKATKNDVRIFDFESFFANYSRAIYPAFVWYAYSAQIDTPNVFPLQNFKNTVRLGYLDIENNGADTIAWVERQVARRVESLHNNHPEIGARLGEFEQLLHNRGVTPEQTYLFMHGHTLMDNVVMIVLDAVCSRLKLMASEQIRLSDRQGQALHNELCGYNNSVSSVRQALLSNENYHDCFLFRKLQRDIESFLRM